MKRADIIRFRVKVLNFYQKNGRYNLPWRKTKDPYKILISEVMLQQTQVSRVLQKYPQFLRAFPTPKTLAKAPLRRILSVWRGMGYNRRAISLKKTAKAIIKLHAGHIPQDTKELENLPGIGPYTARAIAIFAFNLPEVCIETNIRRTYIHHFFPQSQKVSDKKLLPIIETTMDKKNPREWYSALMDYGSHLAKQTPNPNRKSKHYMKQKPFRGSNREARGNILKILSDYGPQSKVGLKEHIKHRNLSQNLENLVREGFLKKQRKKFDLV